MKIARIPIIFVVLSLLVACGGGGSGSSNSTPAQATPTRSFAMGFTPFPYDVDPLTLGTVVDDVYARLAVDADMLAHHFDNGIPWNAALADSYPYDSNIMSVTPTNLARDSLALLTCRWSRPSAPMRQTVCLQKNPGSLKS